MTVFSTFIVFLFLFFGRKDVSFFFFLYTLLCFFVLKKIYIYLKTSKKW